MGGAMPSDRQAQSHQDVSFDAASSVDSGAVGGGPVDFWQWRQQQEQHQLSHQDAQFLQQQQHQQQQYFLQQQQAEEEELLQQQFLQQEQQRFQQQQQQPEQNQVFPRRSLSPVLPASWPSEGASVNEGDWSFQGAGADDHVHREAEVAPLRSPWASLSHTPPPPLHQSIQQVLHAPSSWRSSAPPPPPPPAVQIPTQEMPGTTATAMPAGGLARLSQGPMSKPSAPPPAEHPLLSAGAPQTVQMPETFLAPSQGAPPPRHWPRSLHQDEAAAAAEDTGSFVAAPCQGAPPPPRHHQWPQSHPREEEAPPPEEPRSFVAAPSQGAPPPRQWPLSQEEAPPPPPAAAAAAAAAATAPAAAAETDAVHERGPMPKPASPVAPSVSEQLGETHVRPVGTEQAAAVAEAPSTRAAAPAGAASPNPSSAAVGSSAPAAISGPAPKAAALTSQGAPPPRQLGGIAAPQETAAAAPTGLGVAVGPPDAHSALGALGQGLASTAGSQGVPQLTALPQLAPPFAAGRMPKPPPFVPGAAQFFQPNTGYVPNLPPAGVAPQWQPSMGLTSQGPPPPRRLDFPQEQAAAVAANLGAHHGFAALHGSAMGQQPQGMMGAYDARPVGMQPQMLGVTTSGQMPKPASIAGGAPFLPMNPVQQAEAAAHGQVPPAADAADVGTMRIVMSQGVPPPRQLAPASQDAEATVVAPPAAAAAPPAGAAPPQPPGLTSAAAEEVAAPPAAAAPPQPQGLISAAAAEEVALGGSADQHGGNASANDEQLSWSQQEDRKQEQSPEQLPSSELPLEMDVAAAAETEAHPAHAEVPDQEVENLLTAGEPEVVEPGIAAMPVDEAEPDAGALVPVSTTDQGVGTSPDNLAVQAYTKRKREPLRPPKTGKQKMLEVNIDFFQKSAEYTEEGRRSLRHKVRPLEHWNNERVVHERPPGSVAPAVTKVVLAVPDLRPIEDSPEKKALTDSSHASPVPADGEDVAVEAEAAVTPGVKRKKAAAPPAFGERSERKKSRTSGGHGGGNRPGRASRGGRSGGPATSPPPGSCDQELEGDASAPAAELDPSDLPEGFLPVQIAEGSKHRCAIRIGADSGWGTACDIRIPPESWNLEESLVSQTIFVTVLHAAMGALSVCIDGQRRHVQKGDHLVVGPGQSYFFKNEAKGDFASLKMIVAAGRAK